MNEHWRTLRWGAWLGWQIESNWASPFLFLLYMLVRPFTSSLVLVCMFYAARSASPTVPAEFLPFVYVGNAAYALVGAVMFGMSQAVIYDREHYRMLKYIYVSPARLVSYLIGRGLARSVESILGSAINLTLGVLLFSEVRASVGSTGIAWGWLLVYLLVGVALLISLGVLLSAVVLNMARHGMFLSEGIAGLMYLLSGVVFPLSLLPEWVQWIGRGLPTTYWLEGLRRALLGPSPFDSPLATWSHEHIVMALLASTVVLALSAAWAFQAGERRAWRLGRIEETTGV